MAAVMFVGLGGFIGSVCRYLLSTIPLQRDFPLITFLTNFIGAVIIGAIMEISAAVLPLPKNLLLFLKTGVCGGFTTFSTFSLETATLFENGKWAVGILYAGSSVFACILGVFVGKLLVRAVLLLPFLHQR